MEDQTPQAPSSGDEQTATPVAPVVETPTEEIPATPVAEDATV